MAKAEKRGGSTSKTSVTTWPDWTKYILVVLVFFLYGKTLDYGFVLDDDLFIKNSPVVQSGFSGIPAAFYQESLHHFKGSNFQIYRPAMISFFAIEKALFGFNPKAFHFINLVLYAVVCLAFLALVRTLFPVIDPRYPFFAALIFLVHPIHSEVVANVKSQDELLAALGCILSLHYAIRYLDRGSIEKRWHVYSLAFYLLALFSKESSAVFVGVFPLTVFLLRGKSLLYSLRFAFAYLLAAVVFIGCRYFALRGIIQAYETSVIENVLYGAEGVGEATATRAAILFMYWYKLFWPVNLSWDYSYNQIPVTDWHSVTPYVSAGLYLAAFVLALINLGKRPSVTWGIAFFMLLIVPTANILFLNGTTFAERFLFLPSAGIIVACVPMLAWFSGGIAQLIEGFKQTDKRAAESTQSNAVWLLIVPFVVLASYGTSHRCADWKDNFTLFESASRSAPQSSRVQAGLATEYMNKAENTMVQQDRMRYVALAQDHFKQALAIFPGNSNAAYRLGLIHAITKDTAQAISYYRNAIASKPDLVYALTNLSAVYASRMQYDSALYFLERSFSADSINPMTLTNLVVIHSIRGDDTSVVRYAGVAERNNLMTDKIQVLLNESNRKLLR